MTMFLLLTTIGVFAVLVINADPLSIDEWKSVRNDLSDVEKLLSRLNEKKENSPVQTPVMASKPEILPPAKEALSGIRSPKKQRKLKKKPHLKKPAEQNGVKFESDLVLSPEEMQELEEMEPKGRVRRKAVSNEMKLWPGGVVYYQFGPSLDGDFISKIKDAMRHWEENTCIRFKPYHAGSTSTDRVIFVKGAGCQSPVGRRGGPQEVMISDSCKDQLGSVAHELAHTIGFYHEHSRPDRDDHITVNVQNIRHGFEVDFKKFGTRNIHDIEPYDVASAMHYGPTWMSKDDDSKTLIPHDKNLVNTMGQRDRLSFVDVMTANVLYKCSTSCPVHLKCQNHGYVGPNCACVCPHGLTGRDCTEVQQGSTDCGGVLTDRTGVFTSPNYPGDYTSYAKCYWLITGPPNSSISLTFDDMMVEADDYCVWDFVEVSVKGPHLGGSRFCGEESGDINLPTKTIEYPGNALLVTLMSDDSNEFRGFKARYTVHV